MEELRIVDATTEEHFTAMSLIHALGWRTTYPDAVPADFMEREITDDRWVSAFRNNYETGCAHGVLLYDGDAPCTALPGRMPDCRPGRSANSTAPGTRAGAR